MNRLRLATRSSPQARTQSEVVASELTHRHPDLEVELVFVETLGDRRTDVALHTLGGQGVFVKEVQAAVLDGRADVAVHSAKDLPSLPTPGLVVGAWCERRDPRDALVGVGLDALGPGAVVATGSVRRRAQLSDHRPDLEFRELRGNIATRLSRVPDDGAIVMAVAALEVLGLIDDVSARHGLEILDIDTMIPMVGQGCVAVECRVEDEIAQGYLGGLDDPVTRWSMVTERAFLAELGSGCSLPVAAHVADGQLYGYLADPERGISVRDRIPLVDIGLDEACVRAGRLAQELQARLG